MHRPLQARSTAPVAPFPLVSALLLALIVLLPATVPTPPAHAQRVEDQGDDDPFTLNPVLLEQAEGEAHLGEFVNDAPAASVIPASSPVPQG